MNAKPRKKQLPQPPKKSKRGETQMDRALEKALALRLLLESDRPIDRPKTRGDCRPGGSNSERPCPFAGCRYHLAYDVAKDTGSMRPRRAGIAVEDMSPNESCALDVADRGGETLEGVGKIMNLTRERVRQIEARGTAFLHGGFVAEELDTAVWETTREVAEPAGAEDGSMGAYADPGKEEPDARFRLAFHKTMNARLRERDERAGKKVAPHSSSEEADESTDLATTRALRGKNGAIVPWTEEDQIELELWFAAHELLQPEIVESASALFHRLGREREPAIPEESEEREGEYTPGRVPGDSGAKRHLRVVA